MKVKRTEISTIGEFGLIDRIRALIGSRTDDADVRRNLVLGIGDDCAVFRPSPGNVQLLTTDALVEGVHFDLTFTSLEHLGWKTVAQSFSDLAAMCAVPRYALITLSLPRKVSVEMVEEFYSGASFACSKYGCLIIGGDTTASAGGMMVTSTVAGEAEESRVKRRAGARPGDYLCVTGHLGSSIAGLKILQREKRRLGESKQAPESMAALEPYKTALEKHLVPKPRLDLSKLLADEADVHAVIDVSDGLASDVAHLCTESGVGASIHEHNLPIEPITDRIASEFSDSPTDYALYGGEEFELLFTVSEAGYERLEGLTTDISIIGRITEHDREVELVREGGEHEVLKPLGWDHFKRSLS